jgi:hypothetical protein
MALRDQAKQSGGPVTLRQAAKQKLPNEEMQLNHPTMDSPDSAARETYIPPMPQDRFQFLRDFAMKPGLRNKAAGDNTNR